MSADRHSLGYLVGGALMGSSLGIALGVLMAPKSGRKLREDLSRKADKTARRVFDCVKDIF